MTHHIRHIAAAAATSLFLLCAGASAAFAGPAPIEPEFPPPAQPLPPVPADPGFATEVRWMANGAALILAMAAVVLVAVLWHRSHATGRRLATP